LFWSDFGLPYCLMAWLARLDDLTTQCVPSNMAIKHNRLSGLPFHLPA
jgi:hypothetical protein